MRGVTGLSSGEMAFDDWRAGGRVDRCCLKKVLRGAGLTSYSGDANREFARTDARLVERLGFDVGDLLESTYYGYSEEGSWRPAPYHISHVQESLAGAVANLARELEWYRARMPAGRYYLLGYSLGGLLAFEAAGLLLARDVGGWRGRIAGVAMLSSPLLGVDFGLLNRIALEVANRPDLFGRSGVELVERARNPETLGNVEATAAMLRANGVKLLTITDRNDAAVTPRDAVLPSSRERGEVVTVEARLPADADNTARRFGHGPVLTDPRTIEAVARFVGKQECVIGEHGRAFDPVEEELAALKADLKRRKQA